MLSKASAIVVLTVIALLSVVGCRSSDPLEAIIYDGEHERPSTIAHIAGVSLEYGVIERAYPVSFDFKFVKPVQELLEWAGLENREQLPGFIGITEDNMAVMGAGVFGFGQDFGGTPDHLGFLGNEHMLVPSFYRDEACYFVEMLKEGDEFFDFVDFRVVLKAYHGNYYIQEESVVEEVLFNGTAAELCNDDSTQFEYHQDVGMILFPRPEAKSLPTGFTDIITVGRVENLVVGRFLYFARNDFIDGAELDVALFEELQEDAFRNTQTILSSGRFSIRNVGGPMYYVRGERGDVLRLVGFASAYGGALPADFVLGKFPEEFPHVIEDVAIENQIVGSPPGEVTSQDDSSSSNGP